MAGHFFFRVLCYYTAKFIVSSVMGSFPGTKAANHTTTTTFERFTLLLFFFGMESFGHHQDVATVSLGTVSRMQFLLNLSFLLLNYEC